MSYSHRPAGPALPGHPGSAGLTPVDPSGDQGHRVPEWCLHAAWAPSPSLDNVRAAAAAAKAPGPHP